MVLGIHKISTDVPRPGSRRGAGGLACPSATSPTGCSRSGIESQESRRNPPRVQNRQSILTLTQRETLRWVCLPFSIRQWRKPRVQQYCHAIIEPTRSHYMQVPQGWTIFQITLVCDVERLHFGARGSNTSKRYITCIDILENMPTLKCRHQRVRHVA